MFEPLQQRAERIGVAAVGRAKEKIAAQLKEPGVLATVTETGVALTGRRVGERLRWIGGLFR